MEQETKNMGKAIEFSLTAKKMDFDNKKILHAGDVYEFSKNFYAEDIDIYMSVYLIFLNPANKTTGYAKISQGGLKNAIVDVQIVGKMILDSLASSVIMVQNKPSGNRKPSREDDELTKRVSLVAQLAGSKLLDHVIITSSEYYSYGDEGKSQLYEPLPQIF